MECKIIEVTKRTEGESKSYIEGFRAGAEMALMHGEELSVCAYNLMVESHNAQFGKGDKDDEIRVGDEVIDHTQSKAYTGFIIEVQSADVLKMMSLKDGIWSVRRSNVDKTGRHFPEVEKLLEAMKK